MTEKRRLEIAAAAIRRRTITLNKVLVLLVLIPARGSCDFTVMVATVLVMKSLRLLQLDETQIRQDLHRGQLGAYATAVDRGGGDVDWTCHTSNARRGWPLYPEFCRLPTMWRWKIQSSAMHLQLRSGH